jgi:hypothetical protein
VVPDVVAAPAMSMSSFTAPRPPESRPPKVDDAPVNEICVTDQHIRVAIGLDHLGAAPVRGAHYGGGREALAVKLVVAQAAWQTQG